jgi:DNA-binding response OmpR family regulator
MDVSFLSSSMRRAEILIIDDLMDSLALLLRYFKSEPIEVMVALDGADGLCKAREAQPDLILLDVAMPHMDGYSVCRALKTDPRTAHIPVIFLSANTSLQHKLDGFAAGGIDYVGKPFSSEEVMARVYVHLGTGKAARSDPSERLADIQRIAVPKPDWEHTVVTAALVFLQDKGAQGLAQDELARKVGVNERRLIDLFRKHLGMTIVEYQISQRLELARAMLCDTEQQIQLIARQAGYRNASDFSRAFRNRYGLGPRDYRQASRGELTAVLRPQ